MSNTKKPTTKFFNRHKNAGKRFTRKKWGENESEHDFISKQRIYVKADIRADIEHAANIMCLHFGLSKSSLINHALAHLWEHVFPTIRKSDLIKYDARIKEYVIFRAYKDSRYKREMKQIHADSPSKKEIEEAKRAMEEERQLAEKEAHGDTDDTNG